MASVWVAHDTVLDRDVAVKVLSEALSADDDARVRFTREARAAGRLSGHPHIVTVYDAGEHDEQAYLIMALYEGGTVADRLRDGVPPTATALRWLREAADGLDAAHAADVVHRDVKPANLLLDERDRVAVGDFGIATAAWASSVTQTGLVVGTAAYLAPEQRTGGAATAATDRYALGVVAHQLLTGVRPPDGQLEISLSPTVRDVLSQALAPEPDERPPSARAFVADLERAIGTEEAQDGATTVMVAAPAADPAPTDAPATAPFAPVDAVVPRIPRPARAGGPGAATAATSARARRPGDRRGARALVGIAIVAAAIGVGLALLGGPDEESTGARASTPTADASRSTAEPTATPQATASPDPTATPEPEPEPAAGGAGDPKALNDQGFALFQQGRYAEALPLLQRAVAGLESTPEDQYYAFALYNLGATLRRLGRPAEAIPYLERRLEVSAFKREVVEAELAAAREEAGVAGPATKPGKGNGKAKGKGKKKD